MNHTPAHDDPLSVTSRRIIAQFDQLVPQIHLTLVSILQGLALAAVLLNLRAPGGFTPQAILTALLKYNFYLPVIASLLIITLAWNELTIGTLLLHWPINMVSTFIQFLLCFGEVVAFSNTNIVGVWLLWVGAAMLVAFLMRRRNRLISPQLMPDVERFRNRVYGTFAAWQFALVGCLEVTLGWMRLVDFRGLADPVAIGSFHLMPFDIGVSASCVIVYLMMLLLDDTSYSWILNEVLQGTPYRVSRLRIAMRDNESPKNDEQLTWQSVEMSEVDPLVKTVKWPPIR